MADNHSPSILRVVYHEELRTGWITLALVVLATLVLQTLLFLKAGTKPEDRDLMSIGLLVMPGSLIVLPLIMIIRSSKRKIEFYGEDIRLTGVFKSAHWKAKDLKGLEWDATGHGSVELKGPGDNYIIPFYGLRRTDAQQMVDRLREMVDTAQQKNWNAFLYSICVGQLSSPEHRQGVINHVEGWFLKYVIMVPAALIAFVVFPKSGSSKPTLLMIALGIVGTFVLFLAYEGLTRKRRIEILAAKYILKNGSGTPFSQQTQPVKTVAPDEPKFSWPTE